VFSSGGVVLIWVDMMKMGRIQNKQLDDVVTRIKKLLARKSSHTMAFVLSPLLASAKTLNSALRGETRPRFESIFLVLSSDLHHRF